MLKIKEIKKSEIPEFVWKNMSNDIIADFESFYESEGMFGSKPDYLLVITCDGNGYEGFVYNGNAPECSEFGMFGLNYDKTERIW